MISQFLKRYRPELTPLAVTSHIQTLLRLSEGEMAVFSASVRAFAEFIKLNIVYYYLTASNAAIKAKGQTADDAPSPANADMNDTEEAKDFICARCAQPTQYSACALDGDTKAMFHQICLDQDCVVRELLLYCGNLLDAQGVYTKMTPTTEEERDNFDKIFSALALALVAPPPSSSLDANASE